MVLRREQNEWQAASYIMKTERSMCELLRRVATEATNDELKLQLRKVGSAFLAHRELSADYI